MFIRFSKIDTVEQDSFTDGFRSLSALCNVCSDGLDSSLDFGDREGVEGMGVGCGSFGHGDRL